jgi:hypothetical protein
MHTVPGFSQKKPESFHFMGIRSYSGELIFRGSYREQDQSGDKIFEKQNSYYYSGGILLNASTYILHPNFCELQLGAGYMPESNRDNYLVSPDFSEVRTIKKLNVLTSFFNGKKVNAIASASYDESYAKRENMTNVRTTSKYLGGSLSYSNKYLPLTFDFYRKKLEQTEVETGRKLNLDQTLFEGRAEQSFTIYDKQKFVYTHRLASSINENSFNTTNTSDEIFFNSIVGLGAKRIFTFNTTISNINQYGSFKYNSLQGIENMMIKLPLNFTFTSNYNYNNTSQYFGRLIQQVSTNTLTQQLYKSLNSRFYFEYMTLNHTAYSMYNSKTGFDFSYNKKIPWGQLMLSYGYFHYQQKFNSDSVDLRVVNEEYVLSDSKIVLLKRPYIDMQTVVVKDVTGTIIYQPNLDYFLIARGNYIEIRRIPSGQIPNEGTVFLEYTSKQPSSYKYDSDNHNFSVNYSMLNGRLEVYYRFALQDYKNLENTDYITLNYFTQNIVGFRAGYNMINGGAEYEDYRSSILPYNMVRVYINMQKCFRNKLTLVLNGNIQNYTMLNEPTARVQQYMDVTGKVEYAIVRQTKVNLDVMYRKQQGRGIDLDLLTARLEFTSIIYRLYLTAGIEVYKRNYIGEKINFKGTYIQISRKF